MLSQLHNFIDATTKRYEFRDMFIELFELDYGSVARRLTAWKKLCGRIDVPLYDTLSACQDVRKRLGSMRSALITIVGHMGS